MKFQVAPGVLIFVIFISLGNCSRIKRGGWGNEPSSQNWNVVGVPEEHEPGLPEPVRSYPYAYNSYYNSGQGLPGYGSSWVSRAYLQNYYYY
ncbi:unnamed protein product [Orchesella dallaii]|uniref:Uncharacterized protein n=1 Tax=Orchesella dallaii TaxID=48710 RepID=A0ABP1Q5U7_9HEXA